MQYGEYKEKKSCIPVRKFQEYIMVKYIYRYLLNNVSNKNNYIFLKTMLFYSFIQGLISSIVCMTCAVINGLSILFIASIFGRFAPSLSSK